MTMLRTAITCLLFLVSGLSFAAKPDSATLANCAACHGPRGISPDKTTPNLAGQKAGYVAAQLRAYRDGTRKNAEMAASVRGLSRRMIDSLAKYYAALPGPQASTHADSSQAGAHIRAYCVACHSMDGKTVNQEWPNIAGQKKQYLYTQLMKYKDGSRVHPYMNIVTQELSEQQLSDVAEYYSHKKQIAC